MTVDEIKERVEGIRAIAWDDEYAHRDEDSLYHDFVKFILQHGPQDLSNMAGEVLKTEAIKFCRWCA